MMPPALSDADRALTRGGPELLTKPIISKNYVESTRRRAIPLYT